MQVSNNLYSNLSHNSAQTFGSRVLPRTDRILRQADEFARSQGEVSHTIARYANALALPTSLVSAVVLPFALKDYGAIAQAITSACALLIANMNKKGCEITHSNALKESSKLAKQFLADDFTPKEAAVGIKYYLKHVDCPLFGIFTNEKNIVNDASKDFRYRSKTPKNPIDELEEGYGRITYRGRAHETTTIKDANFVSDLIQDIKSLGDLSELKFPEDSSEFKPYVSSAVGNSTLSKRLRAEKAANVPKDRELHMRTIETQQRLQKYLVGPKKN